MYVNEDGQRIGQSNLCYDNKYSTLEELTIIYDYHCNGVAIMSTKEVHLEVFF